VTIIRASSKLPSWTHTESGELGERRLVRREEAEQFYGKLREQSLQVRVGMEASGHARWFERMLHDLQFELWIGNAAEIRTKQVRKQKTDGQDAQLLLRLMLEGRFPRIWLSAVGRTTAVSQSDRSILKVVPATAQGKSAYQDFPTLWKDADSDIPILEEAKAESLNSSGRSENRGSNSITEVVGQLLLQAIALRTPFSLGRGSSRPPQSGWLSQL
jgi:hypothetical protein